MGNDNDWCELNIFTFVWYTKVVIGYWSNILGQSRCRCICNQYRGQKKNPVEMYLNVNFLLLCCLYQRDCVIFFSIRYEQIGIDNIMYINSNRGSKNTVLDITYNIECPFSDTYTSPNLHMLPWIFTPISLSLNPLYQALSNVFVDG